VPELPLATGDEPFLQDAASRFGTPLVVHDLANARASADRLRGLLPRGSRLLYSLKANPLPPLVHTLQQAGCGVEVSSLGELGLVDPSPAMLFTGPGKSSAEIQAALEAGALLSCESAAEVKRVAAIAPATEVVLRVQPGSSTAAGLSMSDGRQFGFTEQEAVATCLDLPGGLRVIGLHCYVGSQLPDTAALATAFELVVRTVTGVAEAAGLTLRIADLGGGFAWPYAAPGAGPDLHDLPARLAPIVAPLRERGTEIWFESGRALVAPSARLLIRVLDVRIRAGRTTVVVDAGVNVLGGMSGLGRVLRPATVPRNLTAGEGGPVRVDIVGPLCTPLDRLAVQVEIPEPHVGDLLCVDNVGAYATSAALTGFLSRPPATELVVEGRDVIGCWQLRAGHEVVAFPPAGSA
jgi:diaminopimelate decarboxylase